MVGGCERPAGGIRVVTTHTAPAPTVAAVVATAAAAAAGASAAAAHHHRVDTARYVACHGTPHHRRRHRHPPPAGCANPATACVYPIPASSRRCPTVPRLHVYLTLGVSTFACLPTWCAVSRPYCNNCNVPYRTGGASLATDERRCRAPQTHPSYGGHGGGAGPGTAAAPTAAAGRGGAGGWPHCRCVSGRRRTGASVAAGCSRRSCSGGCGERTLTHLFGLHRVVAAVVAIAVVDARSGWQRQCWTTRCQRRGSRQRWWRPTTAPAGGHRWPVTCGRQHCHVARFICCGRRHVGHLRCHLCLFRRRRHIHCLLHGLDVLLNLFVARPCRCRRCHRASAMDAVTHPPPHQRQH